MDHSHDPKTCCELDVPRYDVCQTVDEIGFINGIWTAALEGDVDRVNRLLQKGVHVDATDSAGYTALHYATRGGHVRVCEVLLECGAKVDARTRSMRATPLHRAASAGHVRVIELLLRHGAAPNLMDADGRTALHRAIPPGSDEGAEIVERLLPITDRTIKDNHGRTVDDEFERWKATEGGDVEKILIRRILRHTEKVETVSTFPPTTSRSH
ncbi:PREDICTED: ankyrin repeat domain-containing protein 39 [Vollenhovia emeryi]|uniref:ankyrin repeat domain-containing protein 39 n=1 Tax=Vollenhovia emeryi TaxID=411798 RepID=UPI0005F4E1FC|nr:PREDICTED: ankyrin repeat domain-containing protein 39 [Vollenhovia emeryi]XP_011867984.1 PREDICTED: ankyrin repeat domain-containing protein 39 [Vollenhovia emeryi]